MKSQLLENVFVGLALVNGNERPAKTEEAYKSIIKELQMSNNDVTVQAPR